jgi:hypothetical protein
MVIIRTWNTHATDKKDRAMMLTTLPHQPSRKREGGKGCLRRRLRRMPRY